VKSSVRSIFATCAAFALAAPLHLAAQPAAAISAPLRAEMADRANGELVEFYAARDFQPFWLTADGTVRPALTALLDQVRNASVDGIDPRAIKPEDLARVRDRAADRAPENLARLELAASKLYAAYVKALRNAPRAAMISESAALEPTVPATRAALEGAAAAPSLERYIAAMGWMHPLYAPLRTALLTGIATPAQRRQLGANLERVRALPQSNEGRYVLVDAADQRLWMYEGSRPVGSMRVVVGKATSQTPAMAGFIRTAIVNPYWNVPQDLISAKIAHKVLVRGAGYLKTSGFEVLSGWEDAATVIDPATVDWNAVAAGRRPVRVRQVPGAANAMGRVKFVFPNAEGIYLHDTPQQALMLKPLRTLSNGCVRLEDAQRLGLWLMGAPLPRGVTRPETEIALPRPVPVYLTYLTAYPTAKGIAFRADLYGRDRLSPRQGAIGAAPAVAVR
jgi:hypothetical protein